MHQKLAALTGPDQRYSLTAYDGKHENVIQHIYTHTKIYVVMYIDQSHITSLPISMHTNKELYNVHYTHPFHTDMHACRQTPKCKSSTTEFGTTKVCTLNQCRLL